MFLLPPRLRGRLLRVTVAGSGGPAGSLRLKSGDGRTETLYTPEDEAPTPVRGDGAAEAAGSQGKKKRKPQQSSHQRKRALARVGGADDAGDVRRE